MTAVPSFEAAHDALARRLGAKALRHSEAVAETAADLAARYGVDVEKARLAGLLHDWAREMGSDDLLSSAEAAGLSVTDIDLMRPYLLHARAGALGVKEAFPGIPDDVVRAIELHTTGDLVMTDLDKVVYLADMMEPARSHEGAAGLRAAADEGVPLSELFVRGYAASIEHVVARQQPLHPVTVSVWNSLVAASRREEARS